MQPTVTSHVAPTVTLVQEEENERRQEEQKPLVLRLRAPNPRPHVTWGEGVVDNEHMGRLKSNCCCIYTAPRRWDDPSTWEPDEHETAHCRGHTLPVDKKKKRGEEENKENDENREACGCDHC
uniref:E3 ubiquitin-protein ligase PPP1R11 n=1 Tax=Caenorhabditis japonica TaxID=281687 RepID=A0A8R1DQN2_CAEJA